MKTVSTVLLVVLIAVGAGAAAYFSYSLPKVLSQSPSTYPNCNDPGSISNHVHDPSRLIIVKSCVTASGTVETTYEHGDGDFDMRLRLDPQYRNLTNIANDRYLQGNLVVEIICAHPPTQMSARPSCENYVNHIPLPKVGEHIKVTGPYVLDSGHGNWAEIHPVYTLAIS